LFDPAFWWYLWQKQQQHSPGIPLSHSSSSVALLVDQYLLGAGFVQSDISFYSLLTLLSPFFFGLCHISNIFINNFLH
jgi:hypothetical protein